MMKDDVSPGDQFVLAARFKLLVENLPKLYLTVIANVCIIVALVNDFVPGLVLVPWAVILIAASTVRCLHWRRLGRAGYHFSSDEIRRRLDETDRIGSMLLALYVSVGLFALRSPDQLLRISTMVALWASAVGTAVYLFILPRTARHILVGVTACVCVVFLWTGGKALWLATLVFVAVTGALTTCLSRSFDTFKSALETRAVVEAMQREAMQLAMTDALTGLPNRRAFDLRLALLAASHKPFALGMIDLDRFKPVNDHYGHAVGDKALIIVAHRLRSLGENAFIARLGGDEFALLIDDADRAEGLLRIATDLLSAVYNVDGAAVRMGASCGIAYWRASGDEEHLVEQADAALYLAKERSNDAAGRDKVRVFKAAA